MATQEEKIKALKDLFGEELAEQILQQAIDVQKEAVSSLDFKEHSEDDGKTVAAKAKRKAKPAADEGEEEIVEEEVEEESPEEPEEEPEEGSEEELEEEKELDEYYPLGEVDVKDFGAMLAEAMMAVVEPIVDEISSLDVAQKDSDGDMTLEQLSNDIAESFKEVHDEIVKLRKAIAQVAQDLEAITSDVPKAVKAKSSYVASQDPNTVVSEDNPLLNSAPKADPLNEFANFAIGGLGRSA